MTSIVLFIAQLAVVIGASRLIGLLARRVGQPQVIAEVVAGICLGPSLLGWLWPEAMRALFPPSGMATLGLLSQLGLMLFMFLVGLHLDPELLRGRGRASVTISHSSIVVPFAFGAALAWQLHDTRAPAGVGFGAFALFMGAAMSVTAFPVLARILSERNLMRSKVGAIAIACAAVDDVTAWCLLAFVVAFASSQGLGDAALTTMLAVAYVLLMLFVARPFLARVGARAATREGLTQNLVAVAFLLLFASSAATELIGIHALFGAFLLGAIMPRSGGFPEALAEKIEDVVVVVLLPIFFAWSGLRTSIGLLDSPQDWLLTLVIIAVACAGKFGGSFAAARLTGMSWRESGAIGILMNTRGLMELIVLNIGLDLGVISTELFTMLVLMALATTFMTTPLLHWIYPPDEMAREPAAAPAPSVLMCISDPAIGPAMASVVASMRRTAPLFALRLVVPERAATYMRGEHEDEAEPVLEPLLLRGRALGLDVRPLAMASSDPAADICRIAERHGADLILLGCHKPLLGHDVFGGIVRDVMAHAPTAVGVLVDRGLSDVRRVLVARRGAEDDGAAVALARTFGAELTVRDLGAEADEAELLAVGGGYDLVVVGLGPSRPERLVSGCRASVLTIHRPA